MAGGEDEDGWAESTEGRGCRGSGCTVSTSRPSPACEGHQRQHASTVSKGAATGAWFWESSPAVWWNLWGITPAASTCTPPWSPGALLEAAGDNGCPDGTQ